jgi:putative transposase
LEIMLKTYKYKLEPNKQQRISLQRTLEACREIWNIALEQRKYHSTHWTVQCRELTELKQEFPEYKQVHVHVLQNVVKKLHRAFERMWELGSGFPRFKSARRYHSFSFNNTGFSLDGKQLSLSKIGNVKVRLSRPIPKDSVIKSLTVKRGVNGWYACFAVEVPTQPLPVSDTAVGIDVGIENFAALSDGTMISNPRLYECGQAELRRAQRRVARRIKGSNHRRRAVVLLQKVHERIKNRRMDFLHKTTTGLVRKFGTIVVENLNVKGLARGILSKQVHDASWGTFFNLLSYKAENAGRRLVGVDSKYTSQTCPACGIRKRKLLSERQHQCRCGYTTHRDTAAAEVILARMEPLGVNEGEVIPCVA